MGGLTSLASTAVQALSAVNSFQKDSGRQAYDEQKQKNALELANAQAKAESDKEKIRLDSEQVDAERRAALRRAIAKQKTQYGASGISFNDGSSQAVLLGLVDESDEEKQQRDALDALRNNIIDQNVNQQKQANTLALTQLKERNKYNKYTAGYSLLGGLGGFLD